MKKLVYSLRYKKKLSEIKKYLDTRFGENIRKERLRKLTDQLHRLQFPEFEESGVSLRVLYGLDSDYRYIFTAHNYVFYRIENDCIRIVNIYNEREDFMLDLFGVSSSGETSEAYWDDYEWHSRMQEQGNEE